MLEIKRAGGIHCLGVSLLAKQEGDLEGNGRGGRRLAM